MSLICMPFRAPSISKPQPGLLPPTPLPLPLGVGGYELCVFQHNGVDGVCSLLGKEAGKIQGCH